MGLFSKLLVGMVGFYAGVYCDQNYKLPSVSEPAQLLDEINKMLEEYKNGKSKWRGIPPLSADISPQFQPQISPRMQVWGDWGITEEETFVFAFHKCLSDDWRETKAVLVTDYFRFKWFFDGLVSQDAFSWIFFSENTFFIFGFPRSIYFLRSHTLHSSLQTYSISVKGVGMEASEPRLIISFSPYRRQYHFLFWSFVFMGLGNLLQLLGTLVFLDAKRFAIHIRHLPRL